MSQKDAPAAPARAGDDDPIIVCCLLGLCCPAGSAEQLAEAEKLVRSRQRAKTWSAKRVRARAVAFLKEHDYFRDAADALDAE